VDDRTERLTGDRFIGQGKSVTHLDDLREWWRNGCGWVYPADSKRWGFYAVEGHQLNMVTNHKNQNGTLKEFVGRNVIVTLSGLDALTAAVLGTSSYLLNPGLSYYLGNQPVLSKK
jgi:hypothetical protein